SIRQSYTRAAHLREHENFLADVLRNQRDDRLVELLKTTNDYFLKHLSIKTPLHYSSSMNFQERKSALIYEICRKLGATTYLSGPFGRDYLDLAEFEKAGIEVRFHDYDHPTYQQTFPDFVSHLSVIDLLLNHGEASRSILMGRDA